MFAEIQALLTTLMEAVQAAATRITNQGLTQQEALQVKDGIAQAITVLNNALGG